MYKEKAFTLRNVDDILEEISIIRDEYSSIKRWFLADGDTLAMPLEDIVKITKRIRQAFPETERISAYGTPMSAIEKNVKGIEAAGIDLLYMGIESGDDDLLKRMNKGVTAHEMIQAGQIIKKGGCQLSVTLIAGLGGRELSEQHALGSAKVINAIDPDYIGVLSLMVEGGTPLERWVKNGEFTILTPHEVVDEIGVFLSNTHVSNSVFRANHASNYRPLAGTLPEDKERLISMTGYKGYMRHEDSRML